MVRELGISIKILKEFYNLKKSYRDLDVDKEFDKYLNEKYGDSSLVNNHQEWDNFQEYIYQKHERYMIDTLGKNNYEFYQNYREEFLKKKTIGEPLHYPNLLSL